MNTTHPDGGPGDPIHEAGDYAVWPHPNGGVYITRHDPETGDALDHFWHSALLDDHRFPDDKVHVARAVADRLAKGVPTKLARSEADRAEENHAMRLLPHGVLADWLEERDAHHDAGTLDVLRAETFGTGRGRLYPVRGFHAWESDSHRTAQALAWRTPKTKLARMQAPAGSGAIVGNTYSKPGKFMAAPFARISDVVKRLKLLGVKR